MRANLNATAPARDDEEGNVERLKRKWQRAYCTVMAQPPKALLGGAYVAPSAKARYRWESLALHYFHGSFELPSSIVNPPTVFGQAVGRLLLDDDAGTSDRERLEQCLQHRHSGGIGSAAAMWELWQAYLRTLDRMDLAGAIDRALDLKRDLDEAELQRLNNLLFEGGGIRVYDEVVFAARVAAMSHQLEQALLRMERLREFTQGHHCHPKLIVKMMERSLEPLIEERQAAEELAEQLDGLWKAPNREPYDEAARSEVDGIPVMLGRRSKELVKPRRLADPVTMREHCENRAFWLVEAQGFSQDGAAAEVKRLSGRGKNYDRTNLQVALSNVRKHLAGARFEPERGEKKLHPRLKFLAQITLEVT